MSEERMVYSIQRTYIMNMTQMSNAFAFTCSQRIDVPVIEPLTDVKARVDEIPLTVVPCVELIWPTMSLDALNLVFETNEGVTVLPVKIRSGRYEPWGNPYIYERWVLALPRGTTGIKSCKVSAKNGNIIQHNFTFGIMPPPYNYDNMLFGYISYRVKDNSEKIGILEDKVNALKLTTKTPTFEPINLPKDAGKQTINIEDGVLFYDMGFLYPRPAEPTTHKPKIILHGGENDFDYTLSLNKTMNGVSIDLFTGKITVYDALTGEIFQQFMLDIPFKGFETLSFENFYDIETHYLQVFPKGARVI